MLTWTRGFARIYPIKEDDRAFRSMNTGFVVGLNQAGLSRFRQAGFGFTPVQGSARLRV
jgi:hypothetical protein